MDILWITDLINHAVNALIELVIDHVQGMGFGTFDGLLKGNWSKFTGVDNSSYAFLDT